MAHSHCLPASFPQAGGDELGAGGFVEAARLAPPGGPIFSLALDTREQDGLPNQVRFLCGSPLSKGASTAVAIAGGIHLGQQQVHRPLSVFHHVQVFVGNHAKQVAVWVPPAAQLDSNVRAKSGVAGPGLRSAAKQRLLDDRPLVLAMATSPLSPS